MELLRSETAADPQRMSRALAGLRAYQEAPREPPAEPMPVVGAAHGAVLRDYGGTGAPVLFVPSLINPPSILDLGPEKSLLRWLAARGHHALLLDWGWDVDVRSSMSVGAHVERIVVTLLKAIGAPASLVGYCLGGTMAVAAAALAPVRGVATIAAPWHFGGFPGDARAMLASLWSRTEPAARALGMLPMEVLQSAFWSLDPARTVAKFEAFAELEPGSAEARAFVTLEDWANDGPPIGEAAARELFEGFFADDLPGTGSWEVGGRRIDPAALPFPLFNIVSTTDRIVPAATAIPAGERLDLALGHVGMIIGGRGRDALWKPLEHWLSRQGSS
jgi:polyhydroxyalkanoate synthase